MARVTLLRVAGSNNITEPKWEAKYNASVSRSSNSLTFDPNSAKDTEYNDLLKSLARFLQSLLYLHQENYIIKIKNQLHEY